MTESLPTLEEAKICPRCGKTGEQRNSLPAPASARLPRGTRILFIYCTTELCPWYNTPWQITVPPDGSIPAPRNHTGEPKHYAGIEGHDEMAAAIVAAIKKDKENQRIYGATLPPPAV